MKTTSAELPAELAALSDAALEEWLLNRLDHPAPAFEALTAILASFQSRGHREKAEACADLLHEALAQGGDEERLLALWELRAAWHAGELAFSAVCADRLGDALRNRPGMETLLGNAGFDRGLPAAEGLRRLRVLRGLKPGALCWEKTWGLGVVLDIAAFDQQVRIDFDNKKAHRMSLAHAAESLTVLPDDNLLARRRNDPAGVAEWVRTDPAGVVKSALRSFGPLGAQGLQELLAGRVVPEADWKRFWESARKALKEDPQVEFPARRGDHLRLQERPKAYDDAWLAALVNERDAAAILARIEEWKKTAPPGGAGLLPPAIHNRLDFILRNADPSQAAARVQALLLADDFGILSALRDASAQIAACSTPEPLAHLFRQLPVALIRRLLLFLDRQDREGAANLLFQILADIPQAAFNEALEWLLESGAERQLAELLRARTAAGQATPEMIFWLCRHAEFASRHGICAVSRLALEALNAAENDRIGGERLKARNQIRSLLEQSDWLAAALGAMGDLERRLVIGRLQQSPAWSAADRNALIHRLAQALPELQPLLAQEAAPAAAPERRFTSQHSYRERQAQLHQLITQDIPRNSQDIAVARSYGDLRENFEYKSARETQDILMRRRAEWETMLNAVTATDFEAFPTSAAGMGAGVTIAHEDGRRERFAILGEWDHDDRLGIISSKSRLAEALRGHKPGDRLSIPSETGSAVVTVVDVGGLTPEIKAWINGA